ncbi:MAG: hypothetical protein HOK52_14955 [Candidatus Marinimicrobia bacterium]|jgi:hypothetical protein|nr:hypothetical protein [Candidatus Neomarinimicrobiota bacterium]
MNSENKKDLTKTFECSYKDLPLDDNDDYDLEAFTPQQLSDFYWDNPEAIPD